MRCCSRRSSGAARRCPGSRRPRLAGAGLLLRRLPITTDDRAPAPAGVDILPARAVATALLVLLLTGLAGHLGPVWTVVPTPFPIALRVVCIFTTAQSGVTGLVALLRGVVPGLNGFALFLLRGGRSHSRARWGRRPWAATVVGGALRGRSPGGGCPRLTGHLGQVLETIHDRRLECGRTLPLTYPNALEDHASRIAPARAVADRAVVSGRAVPSDLRITAAGGAADDALVVVRPGRGPGWTSSEISWPWPRPGSEGSRVSYVYPLVDHPTRLGSGGVPRRPAPRGRRRLASGVAVRRHPG